MYTPLPKPTLALSKLLWSPSALVDVLRRLWVQLPNLVSTAAGRMVPLVRRVIALLLSALHRLTSGGGKESTSHPVSSSTHEQLQAFAATTLSMIRFSSWCTHLPLIGNLFCAVNMWFVRRFLLVSMGGKRTEFMPKRLPKVTVGGSAVDAAT